MSFPSLSEPTKTRFQPGPEPTEGLYRAVCYACFRPTELCYCDHLACLANSTPVVILQHPREFFHPLGTARIVARGLSNVSLMVLRNHGTKADTLDALFPPGSGLLYPGPMARDLSDTPVEQRPSRLVVLDGTWHHARTMFRDHAAVRQLPQFGFRSTAPTEYRVRREPKPEYVSTVEAVVRALEILEPGTSYQKLLKPFRRMIDLHISATARTGRRPRHKLQRVKAIRRLPRALVEQFGRAVVVYGEAAAVRTSGSALTSGELCYWTAKRLADGGLFSAITRPVREIDEPRLQHMGLSVAALEHGVELAELRRRWRDFVKPDDIALAWDKSTLSLMQQLGTPMASVSLKAAYRGFRLERAHPGSLRDVVLAEGLSCPPLNLSGRAAERLAQAEAVARRLHAISGIC